MIEHIALAILAALATIFAGRNHVARRKLAAPERLEQHAQRGIDYAEQLSKTMVMNGKEKLEHALAASIRLDRDANGRQDWSDAQHRIMIEAMLNRAASAATR